MHGKLLICTDCGEAHKICVCDDSISEPSNWE